MEKIRIGKYRIICFTDKGKELMMTLAGKLCKLGSAEETVISGDGSEPYKESVAEEVSGLSEFTSAGFKKGNILIFIGAAAIAVRAVAPYVKSKTEDPGVIVIDEKGNFVIPILSGHLGGAVACSKKIADLIGATAVITTATDVEDVFAIDVFASENDLGISDMKAARRFTARLLREGAGFYVVDRKFSDEVVFESAPKGLSEYDESKNAGDENVFFISPGDLKTESAVLIPKMIIAGMGCKKGKSCDELKAFLLERLENEGLDIRSLRALVSIDLKKEEKGLLELSKELGVPFITYPAEVLAMQEGEFSASDFTLQKTGVDNVCERAVMAYGSKRLVSKKTSREGMTCALGAAEVRLV